MIFPPAWPDRYRQMRRDAAYLLLAWPLNVVAFIIVVTLIALGAGTVIIWIGIPILVLGLEICTYFADMERRAVAAVEAEPLEHRADLWAAAVDDDGFRADGA